MIKGILINPFDETIKEIEYSGDYKEIYNFIDCRTFDCAMFNYENDLYIDDEGLLVDNQRYFRMVEIGANYAGKALVLGHDDEGETISTTLTLQMVKDVVQWLPKTHFETPYMEFTAW
jgi:hypothetical protein